MPAHTFSPDNPPAPRKRPAPEPLSYTLPDASAASGLSSATLRRRAKEGLLQLHRVGGRTLVSAASLRALLGVAA